MRTTFILIALGTATEVAWARSPHRQSFTAPSRSGGGRRPRPRGGQSLGRGAPYDDSDEDEPFRVDDGDDVDDGAEYDEYDDEDYAPPSHSGFSRRGVSPGGGSRAPPPPRRRPPPATRFDEYDDDEYDEDAASHPRRGGRASPPPRGRGRSVPPPSSRGGRYEGTMVRRDYPPRGYSRGPPPPSTFTRGLSAIRDKMPDPSTVKETVLSGTKVVKDRTSALSSNLYREVKGLTSSELEQVMLKATRPDETPVKTKHVERLVGVTYQISGKYDIYDAVLRKLWNKMAERNMRTKLKSVYVLHRFAVDGSPGHQEALKQRLRALRKTKDPKRSSGGRGGTRYFDSKVLIGVDDDPENAGYRAFLSRYAHYVLTRAQTFGGVFNEISLAHMASSLLPPAKRGRSRGKGGATRVAPQRPKNPTLSAEHLKFAQMVLKAGLACTLHDAEDSESTAQCVERVASDLMGLTAAVATALKRELKSDTLMEAGSEELIRQWCSFYVEELLPDTKKFCKRVTGRLDVYGLYLPSRIKDGLSTELMEKGLNLGRGSPSGAERGSAAEGGEVTGKEDEEAADEGEGRSQKSKEGDTADEAEASMTMSATAAVSAADEEEEYDEYEYDEYEEYD